MNNQTITLMKRSLIGLFAAIALLLSCAKSQDGGHCAVLPGQASVQWDGNALVAFRPGLEGVGTKVGIKENGETAFEAGDAVRVARDGEADGVKYVYDAGQDLFLVAEGETPAHIARGETARIYYPYDQFTAGGQYSIPAFIAAGRLSDLGDKAPMAATVTYGAEKISFQNLATIIRIDLLGSKPDGEAGKKCTSVSLESTNAALAAGQAYTVDWSGTDPAFSAYADGDKSITVSCDVTLDADTPTKFYFIAPYVASGTIEGLKVTATVGGTAYSRTRASLNQDPLRSAMLTYSFRAGLFYDGAGTSGEPYQIKTADDWMNISRQGLLDKAYRQVADIDFIFGDGKADLTAYMIGDASNAFTGSYNGQGHTLSNFTLNNTTGDLTGLWRYASGAAFEQVLIENAEVSSTGSDVGTLVGKVENGTFADCVVKSTTVAGGNQRTGGIVGWIDGGSMTDCTFGEETEGVGDGSSVTGGSGNTGGLVGIANCDMTRCHNRMATVNAGSGTANGGIAGSVRANVTLEGCTNSGAVKGGSRNYAGGIVAYVTIHATMNNCVNTGPVTGANYTAGIVGNLVQATLTSCENQAKVTSSGIYAGGIAGYAKTNVTLSSCTNSGDVTSSQTSEGNTFAGGILAYSPKGDIVFCTNSGAVSSQKTYVGGIAGQLVDGLIDKCVNAADVTGQGTATNNVGGIAGAITTTVVKRCYSSKGKVVEGGTRVGGIVGHLAGAGQVVNCASYSFVRGKYGTANATVGLGGIVGVQQHASALVANCVALYTDGDTNNYYVRCTEADNQYVGGLVGAKVSGTLQNCYCKIPARFLAIKSKNGATTDNNYNKYMGQITGIHTAGNVTDCYYGGFNSGNGARDFGTKSSGTVTNVTRITATAKSQYLHNGYIPVEVTTSTGNTFAAGTAYLKDILTDGSTGISGYTTATGESLDWENLSDTDFTPIPSALKTLGVEYYAN